jgi:hypothetical protein
MENQDFRLLGLSLEENELLAQERFFVSKTGKISRKKTSRCPNQLLPTPQQEPAQKLPIDIPPNRNRPVIKQYQNEDICEERNRDRKSNNE